MPVVLWTRTAEKDIRQIAEYIGTKQARPSVARRLIDDLFSKANLYANEPAIGTARPDLGDGIRLFTVKRYVVFYRQVSGGIELQAVVDGARDYSRLRW